MATVINKDDLMSFTVEPPDLIDDDDDPAATKAVSDFVERRNRRRGPAARSTEGQITIPDEEEFDGADFLIAPELERIAYGLIEQHERFAHLRDLAIDYSWKAKGGVNGRRPVRGKCVPLKGAPGYFAARARGEPIVYQIWIAADNCEGFGPRQFEALLFHELCHAVLDENAKYGTVGHEFEGFGAELEVYGAWTMELKTMAVRARQLPLDV